MAVCLGLAGCVHALKALPPFREVAGHPGGHVPSDVNDLLARAQALYATRTRDSVTQAAAVYLNAAAADPARTEGLIGAARAHVWLTEHEPDGAARLEAARKAVAEAGWCGRTAPAEPACNYWLGAALGVQARERPSTGLSALPRILESFKKAEAASPGLELGGPDRALALVYLKAPGWPAGPGDPEEGLAHARKAVALAPEYPPNLLALAEALAATGHRDESRESYDLALDLARKRAKAGDPDAEEWIEEAQTALSKK